MKILAFDQSSNLSGFCLLDDDKLISSGVIDKHKIKDSDVRIAEMNVTICEKISELQPECVVIENVQSQGSVATVILLARLQGMILGYCYANGIRAEILSPATWRAKLSFTQGPKVKRDELKQQAINYVADHLGIKDANVDEAEAMCIAIAASHFFN